jgi:hypothetical protein
MSQNCTGLLPCPLSIELFFFITFRTAVCPMAKTALLSELCQYFSLPNETQKHAIFGNDYALSQ